MVLFSKMMAPLATIVVVIGSAVGTPLPIERSSDSANSVTVHELSARGFKCNKIMENIDVKGKHIQKVVFDARGATSMLDACKEVSNSGKCDGIAWMIDGMFMLLWSFNNQNQPAGGIRNDHNKRSTTHVLEAALSGYEYESIEDVTLHARAQFDGEKMPVAISNIHGLVYNNQTLNLQHYDFGNGNGHFYVPMNANLPGVDVKSAFMNHMKRDNPGAGFKLTYANRNPNNLDGDDQQALAHSTGNHWLADVKKRNIHNYIGMLEDENRNPKVYWRIIPEVSGFGLNYESVHICGNLKKYT